MIFLLSRLLVLILISRPTSPFDPFEGTLPVLKCLKGRRISGCNETLLEAYERTKASETDQNMNDADTGVYLYTRRNKAHPEFLHKCGGGLPTNSLYRKNRDTVIIVGGHLCSVCGCSYFRDMKNQFLYRDDYNIILINWYWGNGPDIYLSMHNTKVVGKQMAFVIEKIMTQTGTTGDKFHIVGHAYGAHAAGIAGKYLETSKLRRITGLDPFGGWFIIAPDSERLVSTDAKLVDVIHTGAGDCFPLALGTTVKSGHADFYPNGGSHQPGCLTSVLESYLKGDVLIATLSLYAPACDLFQSVRFFLASINPCNCEFVGVECESYEAFKAGACKVCDSDRSNCAVMGLDYEKYPHKIGNYSYFLKTTSKCPYCDNSGVELQGFSRNDSKIQCFDLDS